MAASREEQTYCNPACWVYLQHKRVHVELDLEEVALRCSRVEASPIFFLGVKLTGSGVSETGLMRG